MWWVPPLAMPRHANAIKCLRTPKELLLALSSILAHIKNICHTPYHSDIYFFFLHAMCERTRLPKHSRAHCRSFLPRHPAIFFYSCNRPTKKKCTLYFINCILFGCVYVVCVCVLKHYGLYLGKETMYEKRGVECPRTRNVWTKYAEKSCVRFNFSPFASFLFVFLYLLVLLLSAPIPEAVWLRGHSTMLDTEWGPFSLIPFVRVSLLQLLPYIMCFVRWMNERSVFTAIIHHTSYAITFFFFSCFFVGFSNTHLFDVLFGD